MSPHHRVRASSGSRRPSPTGGAVALSSGDGPVGPVTPAGSPSGWVLVFGLGCLVFTVGAVSLEVLSGQYANSAVPTANATNGPTVSVVTTGLGRNPIRCGIAIGADWATWH